MIKCLKGYGTVKSLGTTDLTDLLQGLKMLTHDHLFKLTSITVFNRCTGCLVGHTPIGHHLVGPAEELIGERVKSYREISVVESS